MGWFNNNDAYSAGVNSHDSDDLANSKITAYYANRDAQSRMSNHHAKIASLSYEDYRIYVKIRNGIIIAMVLGAAAIVAYCKWFY